MCNDKFNDISNRFCLFCKRVLKENVALGKTTWQRHPWPDDRVYGVDKEVDRRYSKSSEGGRQCTISENLRSTAEWRLYLGRVFNIRHIDIYNMRDS